MSRGEIAFQEYKVCGPFYCIRSSERSYLSNFQWISFEANLCFTAVSYSSVSEASALGNLDPDSPCFLLLFSGSMTYNLLVTIKLALLQLEALCGCKLVNKKL